MTTTTRGWQVVDFQQVPGVACPCGTSRRAFLEAADYPASVHLVDISLDARLHYHKRLTEMYFIVECGEDAQMQLDDEFLPLRPGMCVLIRPGVRHRAIGQMRVLNVVLPKFDPQDEWFD
jgi:mannose-6-phosphate isomerase-like protein (cupin superfamily)